ncbi:hypothetical protein [Legionella waltersii]|uniref:Uncharacterized protein n=1 Tax=Legionella waltersii TaxID=66969 RepID=A0A0W1ANY3_9GAMM|nr:hypothetical protein [Legionella waltersii]KTD82974.1 hypothetical protein Lwal_0193 [Legionella waltersii]SNU97229.1 Uncharacterised protein [Legionella waltersii]
MANSDRGGAIYAGVSTGCTSVPGILNRFDGPGHFANGASFIVQDDTEEVNASVAMLN